MDSALHFMFLVLACADCARINRQSSAEWRARLAAQARARAETAISAQDGDIGLAAINGQGR